MLDLLKRLFTTDEFMPHGHCYLWQPGIVWLHVLSDAMITLAYTTIPFTLLYFVRRRRDLPYNWMFLCFGVFIIACGSTHLMEIVTLWNPVYWLSGGVKAVTAVASLATAVALVQLIPSALALPSPEDMRRATAALRTSEARFRGAIGAGLDAFFVLEAVRDADGRIVDFTAVEMNGEAQKLTPTRSSVAEARRGRFADHPEIVAKHARVTETREPLDEEIEIEREGMGPTWFHHQVVPVGDGVAVTLRNITRRKQEEEARLLAAIVDSSEDAIIGKSVDGTIRSWNPGAKRLYGYSAVEVIGKPSSMLLPAGAPDDVLEQCRRLERGEVVEGYESRRRRKDGAEIDVSMRVSPIRDDSGAMVGLSAIARDITTRKDADRKLKASLREKEVLLKEVHHRVKNNLQVISSLLNLEAGRVTQEEALTALRASQSRLRSIALFHESIYQSRDLSRPDIGKYMDDLLRGIRSAYTTTGRRVTVEAMTDDVALDADQVIPLGLITNELVSNAYKHAFPEGQGRIEVALRARGAEIELVVSDDGIGLPEDLDISNTSTLGLQLVHTLADQIGGRVTMERSERGSVISVSFGARSERAEGLA